MIRRLLLLLALLPVGLTNAQDVATVSGPARASLERFAKGLESYSAGFSQTVIAADGRLVEEGSGEVWMRRPDHFRWAYAGEFPELIVADGSRVWVYDETLEQVTVREQSALPENSPLMLLTDLSGIDEQFTITELGDNEGTVLLALATDKRDAEFERVILGFRDDELVVMIMEDAFGMRSEVRFIEVVRNPDLAADLFRFTVPPGVDVIGEAELLDP